MSTIQDALERNYAPAWKPAPGDMLVGEVTQISERDGGYGMYPVVTIRQDDGEELAFHGYHSVAANQLAEACPAIGQRIGVKYKGKVAGAERPYHSYTVKVDRPAGASIDWSRYGDGQEPAAAPQSTALNGAPLAAEQDDIPF